MKLHDDTKEVIIKVVVVLVVVAVIVPIGIVKVTTTIMKEFMSKSLRRYFYEK